MRSERFLKIVRIGYIVMSSLFCLLGLLMLIHPELSISVIGITAGIMLIVFGIVKLAGYLSNDLYQLAFQHDLATGLLVILLGAMLVSAPRHAADILCLILGICILTDGLFKLQTAVDAKRFGLSSWWLILLLGLPVVAIGAVAAFRPGSSAQALCSLLGASMLAEGLLNLSVVLCAVRVRHCDHLQAHA